MLLEMCDDEDSKFLHKGKLTTQFNKSPSDFDEDVAYADLIICPALVSMVSENTRVHYKPKCWYLFNSLNDKDVTVK